MTDEKGRLIIVDPSLKDMRGHHYALTSLVADSAINDGFEVIVFSNKSVDASFEIMGAKVKPVFGMSTYDYFRKLPKKNKMLLKDRIRFYIFPRIPEPVKIFLKKVRSKVRVFCAKAGHPLSDKQGGKKPGIADELLSALLDESVTCSDHVLFHTADAMIYHATLQIIQKLYPLGETPNYHLCTPYDMKIMPHASKGMPVDRVINYMRLIGAINSNVFLYAENELLADSLARDWKVDVSTLDIPMKKIERDNVINKYENDSVIRVVYLGAAREEKGFHLLPGVVKEVIRLNENKTRIEFIVQCSPQIVGYTSKIEAAIEELKHLPGNGIKLLMQQQSMEEYQAILESSDIVLLCYQQENYQVRGSGIATEAVAYAKNVVTTPGTYPAWLSGEAGITATGSKEVAAAILHIANNQALFSAKAEKRAEWFFDKTRPDNYVNKLINKEKSHNKPAGCTSVDLSLQGMAKSKGVQKVSNKLSDGEAGQENKYNGQLREAAVSEDGHLLFVS